MYVIQKIKKRFVKWCWCTAQPSVTEGHVLMQLKSSYFKLTCRTTNFGYFHITANYCVSMITMGVVGGTLSHIWTEIICFLLKLALDTTVLPCLAKLVAGMSNHLSWITMGKLINTFWILNQRNITKITILSFDKKGHKKCIL